MRRFAGGLEPDGRRAITLAVILVAALGSGRAAEQAPAAGEPAKAAPDLKVAVESLRFYYVGDPVLLRVTFTNEGRAPYDNGKGLDISGGLALTVPGAGVLKRKPATASDARRQPSLVAAGAFFGYVLDLRDLFEGLDKPGRYSAIFQSKDLVSTPASVVVIPRYDPTVAYQATIETDYGTLVFDLFGRSAPKHVQNFHDLGNQGYYDGSLIHFVAKGIEIHAGETSGDGAGGPGYDLPLEMDPSLPQKRGMLSMLRGRTADHGAQFVVALAENPGGPAPLSVFGSLVSGEEALAAIENLPTSGRQQPPFYRPLQAAPIKSLRVAPAPEGSKATPAQAVKEPSAP